MKDLIMVYFCMFLLISEAKISFGPQEKKKKKKKEDRQYSKIHVFHSFQNLSMQNLSKSLNFLALMVLFSILLLNKNLILFARILY